jgi:NAD(P)-dependent dehydrogenase (short-subunit alcohol dehydrogenase family)
MGEGLWGRRVVVAGASAGIGRCFAAAAVRSGAEVVLGSRRTDVLDEVVKEAGGGMPVALDVCDPASRRRFLEVAAEQLGSFDLVLSSVGWADMRPLAETDDAVWVQTMATNLIGPTKLLGEALPALASTGIVAVLSSETVNRPRRDLVPYSASKAAGEAALAGLRLEHPGTRVSCVVVGGTFPTEFGKDFDGDQLVIALEDWQRHGLLQQELMVPEDVAGCLVELYGAALRYPGVCVEEILLRSPSPVLGTPQETS